MQEILCVNRRTKESKRNKTNAVHVECQMQSTLNVNVYLSKIQKINADTTEPKVINSWIEPIDRTETDKMVQYFE